MSDGIARRERDDSDYEILFLLRDMIELYGSQQRLIFGQGSERLERISIAVQNELDAVSD